MSEEETEFDYGANYWFDNPEDKTEEIKCSCDGLLLHDPDWDTKEHEYYCCEDCGTYFKFKRKETNSDG